MGIDIGKNSFHVVGLDQCGAIVLRQKWSRGQVVARLANIPPCLIGMEACVGAHHLSRKLQSLGHDARLMPARYVRAYLKGQKNDEEMACFRYRAGRGLRVCSTRSEWNPPTLRPRTISTRSSIASGPVRRTPPFRNTSD
jgi:transposase